MTTSIGSKRYSCSSRLQLLMLFACALVLQPEKASAQAAAARHPVITGDSVRLWSNVPVTLRGTRFVAERYTADSLIALPDISVNLRDLSRLEVRRTVKSRSAARIAGGFFGGLLVGSLVGGAIGYAATANDYYGGYGVIVGVPVGGVLGAVTGAIIGAGSQHEAKWVLVPLPR